MNRKDLHELVEGSDYILCLNVFEALNQQGDYISYWTLDDMDHNISNLGEYFSDYSGTSSQYYWVNEHTCPTNLINTKSVIHDGPYPDPHGVLTLIGYLPENVIKSNVEHITRCDGNLAFGDGNGVSWGADSNFFNELLRLYKSIYHMINSSYVHVEMNEDLMEYNKWGQPYYFSKLSPENHSRVNYLVCEILVNSQGLWSLLNIPKGRIIDINQDVNYNATDEYNELIYGFPEWLFEEIGYDRFLEILEIGDEHWFDDEDIIKNYYQAEYIQKVVHFEE